MAAAVAFAGPAGATDILKLTLTGSIGGQYDFPSGSYEPLPVSSPVTVTAWTVLDPHVVTDYGVLIGVQYPFGGGGLDDPFLPFVGADPFGDGLTDLADSGYAFTGVQDYPTTFRQYLSIVQQVGHSSGDTSWSYRGEILIELLGPKRAGDGSSDFPLEGSALTDFLDGQIGKPTAIYSAYWAISASTPPPDIDTYYTAGKSWRSTDMTLLSYELVGVSAVPEPAAWLLMITGFGACGGALRRRATHAPAC
jgi:hypothetical protein